MARKKNSIAGTFYKYAYPITELLGYAIERQIAPIDSGVDELTLIVNHKTTHQTYILRGYEKKHRPKVQPNNDRWLWRRSVDYEHCLKHVRRNFSEGVVIYRMPYTPNLTLLNFIHKTWSLKQDQPTEEMLKQWALQMLLGVDYLHRKEFYLLDVCPNNMIFDGDWNLKICDFGFMCSEGDIDGRVMLGNTFYMPPEAFDKENKNLNLTKVDIWGCGVIILQVMTGKLVSCRNFIYANEGCQSILPNLQVNHPKVDDMELPFHGGHELIRCLITWDPWRRWSATRALTHPWLAPPSSENGAPITITESDKKPKKAVPEENSPGVALKTQDTDKTRKRRAENNIEQQNDSPEEKISKPGNP